MGLGERQANGAGQARVWRCSGAETEDRDYALASSGSAETERSARCEYPRSVEDIE